MKNLKNALNAYAVRKSLTKMNFIKYKGTNEKTALTKNKRKGSKALKATKGSVKKNTRYTRQFAVNLTKAMSTVKSLLKINKKNKVGKILKGRG